MGNDDEDRFGCAFKALTEHDPFPWQRTLYDDWFSIGKFPPTCNLPTGLGKTSVIAVWLIALANHPTKVPRRLVYVVNRRTVVDQTTVEVESYRKHSAAAGLSEPLALSTLRGQFADNREWSADPSRPAVICGTVDMIGSRLLFSGYGCGFKSKPLHAGFLGQDVLLIHDEAHLEPAFQELLIVIEREQRRCGEFGKFHVVELSATSRGSGEVFQLTPADLEDEVVQQRIGAKKSINLHELADEKKLSEPVSELALAHRDSKLAILVFVRTVEAVERVADRLRKAKLSVETLTGTMRGKERDELVEKPVFQRFISKTNSGDETVYLVCTSAGEVGVNISADHLVCDLSTFDSMAQRFGRVNRLGECDDTRIDVVHPAEFDEQDRLEERRSRTLALLRRLEGDGSPKALGKLDPAARREAFAPEPIILPATDILFDAWALTTIRDKLPGRPPVEEYLHGVSEWEPPQTSVAWREEVGLLTMDRFAPEQLAELIDDYYPLKPHELLKDRTDRVFKQIEKIARRVEAAAPVWVIERDESFRPTTVGEVVDAGKEDLNGVTLLMPPQAGGLRDGLLNGDSEFANDVADEWFVDAERQVKRRARLWDGEKPPDQMRLVRRIDFPPSDEDEDAEGRSWAWYIRPASADDDGSKSAKEAVKLVVHTNDVFERVKEIAKALLLPDELQLALGLAGKFHDLGKRRLRWQANLGNPNPEDKTPYAKSGRGWRPREIGFDYRHEFGSLLDLQEDDEFKALADKPDVQDLILHLVAAHHGRGRPHFPSNEAFDVEKPDSLAAEIAREVPRRFARLQRKYGRWGLAYLESLLRAADIAASINPSEVVP